AGRVVVGVVAGRVVAGGDGELGGGVDGGVGLGLLEHLLGGHAGVGGSGGGSEGESARTDESDESKGDELLHDDLEGKACFRCPELKTESPGGNPSDIS